MRVDGQEGWYPLVTWGTHWYEADGQWEVLLEDASDIEIFSGKSGRRRSTGGESIAGRSSEENRLFFKTSSRGYVLDERTCN